jgi:hypothetical protein
MTQFDSSRDRDLQRVTEALAGRLRTRGIDVSDIDDPADVESVMAAVEAFERAVTAAGGDLMVDEPPTGAKASPQPDNPAFLLPTRRADESIARYIARLDEATENIQASE